MKTTKTALIVNKTYFHYGTTIHTDDVATFNASMYYMVIDEGTFVDKHYNEFTCEFFKDKTPQNPSTEIEVRMAFEAFKVIKLQQLEEEHKEYLARKRAGKKYMSALICTDKGHYLEVFNSVDIEYAARIGYGVVLDQYNYPNHYYRAFIKQIKARYGSLYSNPVAPAQLKFLFAVFKTEYKDYAAVKKAERVETKQKALEEAQQLETELNASATTERVF